MATTTQETVGARPGSKFTDAIREFFLRVIGFFRDVRMETKKLSTPSRKEVQATTAVVLITVALFGVYFFAIDKVIGFGLERLLEYATKQ
jgi:preprotein translocase subunit SecE